MLTTSPSLDFSPLGPPTIHILLAAQNGFQAHPPLDWARLNRRADQALACAAKHDKEAAQVADVLDQRFLTRSFPSTQIVLVRASPLRLGGRCRHPLLRAIVSQMRLSGCFHCLRWRTERFNNPSRARNGTSASSEPHVPHLTIFRRVCRKQKFASFLNCRTQP